jgi:UPF0271 protein
MPIDLNCDLGEGCPHDAALLALVTSANVSCGGHAGTLACISETLSLAQQHSVQVGAHPGFPDREHFGRRELPWSTAHFLDCVYQVGGLIGLARARSIAVRYLKPHGALYNLACREQRFADTVAAAALVFRLPVMGLPGSVLEREVKQKGLRFIAEGFADRRYQPDGALVPRTQPHAMIETPEEAVAQAEWLIRDRGVETICVHGDNVQAVDFVRRLRDSLTRQGIEVRPFMP